MKRLISAIVLSLVPLVACAQEKPPTIPVTLQNKIIKAQRDLQNVRAGKRALEDQWKQLDAQEKPMTEAFQKAIDEAFADAKLPKEKWQLDLNELKFVPFTPTDATLPKK